MLILDAHVCYVLNAMLCCDVDVYVSFILDSFSFID